MPAPTTPAETVDALRFLIDVARELRAKGHPCKFIELVAGTRVAGVWQGIRREEADPEKKVANIISIRGNRGAIQNLLTALLRVEPDARAADIKLALELEPGPGKTGLPSPHFCQFDLISCLPMHPGL